MKLVFAAFGIASAITAFLKWRLWGAFVALMALLYLGTYLLQFQFVREPILEAWTTAAQVSLESGRFATGLSFFWNNLIQPVFFLGVAVYLLYYRPDAGES